MSEERLMELYREITGVSESQARCVIMYLEVRQLALGDRQFKETESGLSSQGDLERK